MQNFADNTAPNAPNVLGAAIGVWCNLSPTCTNCTIYLGDGALVHSVQRIGAESANFYVNPGRLAQAASARNFAGSGFGRGMRERQQQGQIRGHDTDDKDPGSPRTGP